MTYRNTFSFYLAIFFSGFFTYCTPNEEIISSSSSHQLSFSSDTISFDTLITTLKSTTKRLIVKNDNSEAVKISRISLQSQNNSPYLLYINGKKTNVLENKILLGKDSLLVLIETTLEESKQDETLARHGKLEFLTNGNLQTVNLEAWAQDAIFLDKKILTENTVFDSKKPYILKDTLTVGENSELTLAAGTRIYANRNALVLVKGKLTANGTVEERIELRNSRLEKNYEHATGQWAGIKAENAQDMSLKYLSIRNADYGIIWKNENTKSSLNLESVIIQNMLKTGLDLESVDLVANNTLINTCGKYLIRAFGGEHNYNHCTLVNFHSIPPHYRNPALSFLNFTKKEDKNVSRNLKVNIKNSILTSNKDEALGLELLNEVDIENIKIENSLLATSEEKFKTKENRVLNYGEEILFQNLEEFNYDLDSIEVSPASELAKGNLLSTDLLGRKRKTKADAGAYEQFLIKKE